MLKFMFSILLLVLVCCSALAASTKELQKRQTRKGNLSGASNRVQMRVYRGPDAGDNTQWGFFVRQPAFE